MSDKKADSNLVNTTSVIDAFRDNTLRILDEIVRGNPYYAQAQSNLQLDFVENTRNFVRTAFEAQKHLLQSYSLAQFPQVSDAVVKQSSDATTNLIRAIEVCNQLTVKAFDAARENTKIMNATVERITEYNTRMLGTWTDYWSHQKFAMPY